MRASSCNSFLNIVLIFFTVSLISFGVYIVRNVEGDAKLEFMTRLKGPIKYDDDNLIKFVKKKLMNPPGMYITSEYKGLVQSSSWTFYNTVIQHLYNDKLNGYFIEAGAVDGRIESNTAYLEWAKQWTGLLIEPDKQMYSLLKASKRNCWTANCCLAQLDYPMQGLFATSGSPKAGILHKVFSEVVRSEPIDYHNYSFYATQCIPLATLVLALNKTFVDLLSLDIQGGEEGVLGSFPWSVITIDTLLIEHVKRNATAHHVMDKEFIKKLSSYGYRLFVYFPPWDYVFIRRGSQMEKKRETVPHNFLDDNVIFT